MEKCPFHGYVNSEIHGRFEQYLENLGLTSASALVCLLIAREIELKRLGSAGPSACDEPRGAKVSAYVPEPQATRFKEIVGSLHRSASDCVAELVEREVDEKWLFGALRRPPEVRAS